MTPERQRLCVSVQEASEMIGVSPWVVRKFIRDGALPAVKLPSARRKGEENRRVLISVADLQAFVERHRAK